MKVYVVLKWVFDLEDSETSFSYVRCVVRNFEDAIAFVDKGDVFLGSNRWCRYTISEHYLGDLR